MNSFICIFLTVIHTVLTEDSELTDTNDINDDEQYGRSNVDFSEHQPSFQLWIDKYKGNDYRSQSLVELQKRLEIFAMNRKIIDRLNDTYISTNFAVNEYADLTWNEFKIRLHSYAPTVSPDDWNGSEEEKNAVKLTAANVTDLPKHISWKYNDYLSPVRNQGTRFWTNPPGVQMKSSCSGGWVFATIDVAEAKARKVTSKKLDFSVQQLLECVDKGCAGGDVRHAFGYFKDAGIVSAAVAPFIGSSSENCSETGNRTRLTAMRDIARDEFRMAYALRDGGPFAVTFKVGKSFQFYNSGILMAEDCQLERDVWHSFAVTGFGNGYWEIKNSFGTSWGTGGFGQVKRGSNWCHIEDGPTSGW